MIKQDFVGLNIFSKSVSILFCYKMQGVLARYARGPRFESQSGLVLPASPVTSGGSVWVRARIASSKGTVLSHWYLHGSEQIRGRIYLSMGKLSQVDRLARVLAWYGRAPGFKSRSGHVLFPPL